MNLALCLECETRITPAQKNYSLARFGVPLCFEHQDFIREKLFQSQPQVVELYLALRKRGVPCEMEKKDGFKTIDLAVEDAKIYIEVDGAHHHFDHDQALRDLQRTYYSFKEGYVTLHVSNELVDGNLEETANWLTEIINENIPRAPKVWGRFRKVI